MTPAIQCYIPHKHMKRVLCDSLRPCEKILRIICYQGMQIKTIKHHYTLLEWPKSGIETTSNVDRDVGPTGTLIHCG